MARETDTAKQLGAALASASAAVVVTSPVRVVTAANAAAHTLLEYPPSALAGQQMRALYAAGDDYAAVDAAIQGAGAHRSGTPLPVTLRSHSGALLDVHVVVLPILQADGKLASIIEIMTPAPPCDAEATAEPVPREHADLLRFARGAAHDFKNLLAIIAGNMDLAKDSRNESLRRKFFEDAQRASRDAVRIADQMISFARHQHVAPEIIDVAEMIGALVPVWQSSLCNGLRLTIQTHGNLPPVLADRSGLENALLNLVLNARDAVADRGDVVISAAIAETSFDAGESPRAYVAIAVRDTGTGMTDHIRRRAFDPFFSTKPASHGRGLGLATVAGFARQANGHVAIDSMPGGGTTVTIYLPPATE